MYAHTGQIAITLSKSIMQYCTSPTPDSPPQSCMMMNIDGVGSGSCFHGQPSKSYEPFDFATNTVPIDTYITEDSLLRPMSRSKNTIETSPPYSSDGRRHYFPAHHSPSHKCTQTLHPSRNPALARTPWPAAAPRSWSDLDFPIIDFLSGAPVWSWSGFGLGDHYMKHYSPASNSPASSHNTRSQTSGSGSREGKRPSRLMEPRALPLESKKSRSNPLVSCPPLKVRKEKLGERIAALQQLVAPYGKTDTASVLSEAIGYIKFLQDQVEALSLPYIRFSRVRTEEKSKGGLRGDDHNELTEAEPKGELRRQGLCLVPLPCMSHIDFANCGGPPIFNLPFPRVA